MTSNSQRYADRADINNAEDTAWMAWWASLGLTSQGTKWRNHSDYVDRYLDDPVHQAHVRTILKGATDSIARRGWCRHELMDIDGRVCLFGAMLDSSLAAGVPPEAAVPALALADRVTLAEPNVAEAREAVAWNDEQAADGASVIAVLNQALDLLDTY